jgi:hypothetical protein
MLIPNRFEFTLATGRVIAHAGDTWEVAAQSALRKYAPTGEIVAWKQVAGGVTNIISPQRLPVIE